MRRSFGLATACLLGLGLATSITTGSLAQNTYKQGSSHQGGKVVVKKAPVVVQPQRSYSSGRPTGQHSGHQNRSNTGRNIAVGVAAGVVGAIILNEAAKASGGYDGEYSCESLERRCDNGQDWACRRLDRNSC
jgi:hypothetical protein